MFDVTTSKLIRTFKHDGPEGEAVDTNTSSDGKWFVCPGLEGGLKAWDVEKGVACGTFKGLKKYSFFLFSPDGARLAACDVSGALMIWDRASGRELGAAKLKNARIHAVYFSPDGKRLAAACELSANDFEVRILDAESRQEVSPPLKGEKAGRIIFSPDGKRLATGSNDGRAVKLWDLTTGQATLTLNGHKGFVTDIAFSPDGQRLISASVDMSVRIWDARPLPE